MKIKSLLRKTVEFGFSNIFNSQALQLISKKCLTIIYYHHVAGKEEQKNIRQSGMYVDIESFDKQMCFLKKHYRCVSEKKIIESIENEKKLPENSLWITFDDGYMDNYTNAYPILRKYKLPATFFITTGYINRQLIPWDDYIAKSVRITSEQEIKYTVNEREHRFPLQTEDDKTSAIIGLWRILELDAANIDTHLKEITSLLNVKNGNIKGLFMSWDNVLELSAGNISIGAHTATHKILSDLQEDEALKEITDSKKEIEQKLGKDVVSFAFIREFTP